MIHTCFLTHVIQDKVFYKEGLYQFLVKANGYFSELKALIFLGDFFDLCTDSLEDIVNKQKNIFKLMHKFMLEKEISIFFTLGNHEIPVNGNYERKFKRRKRKFVKKLNKKLKKHLNKPNFFSTDCFCQYIILNKA